MKLFDILCLIFNSQRNRNHESADSVPSVWHADQVIHITRLTKGKALGRDESGIVSEVNEDGQHRPSVVCPCSMSEQSKYSFS